MKTQLNETGQPLHGFILNGLCDENIDFLNVVTVEFESESYPVLFTVVDGNGTLEALVNGVVSIISGTSVPYERTIVFTATANSAESIYTRRTNVCTWLNRRQTLEHIQLFRGAYLSRHSNIRRNGNIA